MRVFGVDPGSRLTGFGVIDVNGRHLSYVTSGTISLGSGPIPERLGQIFEDLSHLIREYQPQQFAIEQVFLGKNVDSALKLGHARGAAIVAAKAFHLPVYEYSARSIKQAVVGSGAAAKSQVQHMILSLLNLPGMPKEDAADALAVAVCHAHMHHSSTILSPASLQVKSRRGRWR